MASFNKVVLMGHLARDPELRYTAAGAAVCNFSIAMNRSFTKKEGGEKVDEATFVDVTAWNRTAEVAAEFLKKGRSLMVEGRLTQSHWVDEKSGQKRSKLMVTAERLVFLGSKKDGNGAPEPEAAEEAKETEEAA